jgi:inorganic pyrophosphatase
MDLSGLDPHWLREIEDFFRTYTSLEGRQAEVVGWQDAAAARGIIASARVAGTGWAGRSNR